MKRKKRYKITPYFFTVIWTLADSVETVVRMTQRPLRTVRRWERELREAGVRLKKMPRYRSPDGTTRRSVLEACVPSEN